MPTTEPASKVTAVIKDAIERLLKEQGGELTPYIGFGIERMTFMVEGALIRARGESVMVEDLTLEVIEVASMVRPDFLAWVNTLSADAKAWWDANVGQSHECVFMTDEQVHGLVQRAIYGLKRAAILRAVGFKDRGMFPPFFFMR